jgi:tetratricopeptide (TPR) repeat protein
MRRLAPQVARWLQHRLPQSTAQLLPPVASQQCRTVRKARGQLPPLLNENEKEAKVRLFEQDTLGSKDRKELPLDDDAEAEAVYNEIKRLDEELKQMEKGPLATDSPFMQSLTEAERSELLEELRKSQKAKQSEDGDQGGAEEYQLVKEAVKATPKVIDKVTLQVPREYQVIVNKFNTSLEQASSDERPLTAANDLWIWYNRCKHAVPYFLHSIPRSIWDTLWDVQNDMPSLATRVSHLRVLSEDVLTLGATLTPAQSLTYIKCLDLDGDKERAIETWKACEIDLEEAAENVTEYLSLGLRLYSSQGNLKEAKRIARDLFRRQGIQDFRSVKPMILAQSSIEGDAGAKQAWTTYLQLKQGLGKAMAMEDYDELSIDFLKTGRPDLAIAVFKDMMLSQQASPHTSEALYKTALGQIGKLQSSAVKESDLTKLSLGALTILPRQFQNKYFYGSWLKKLIGMQEIEAAAMVIDLMFERGVKPDARYLNGMIGAWFRTGNASSRTKAESMGWSMIRARIDFVSQRSSPKPYFHVTDPSSIDSIQNFTIPPSFIRRDVPLATIETFALLTQFYSRRSMDNVVQHLLYCLKLAEIPPNSFIMNHLLFAQLRKHDLNAVTGIYQEMSPPVQPDLQTFACFWDCSKLSHNRMKDNVTPTDFPTPRSLYRGMLNWFTQLPPKARDQVKGQFSKELYDQIILCFCLSRDLQGTLLGLHSLKDLFNIYPDQNTASMVAHRIARLLPVNYAKLPSTTSAARRRLRRLSGNPEHKTNLAKVAQVLETMYERRVEKLEGEGLVLKGSVERPWEVQLGTLGDLIMTTLWKVVGSEDKEASLRRRFDDAAAEMGCSAEWFDGALKSAEELVKEGVV